MRVYVFTEHYPNLYKPYFDTQFHELLRQGHDVRVFAFGAFDAQLTAKARALLPRTRYLPLTLRTLPGAAPRLRHPAHAARVWSAARPWKRNLLDAARAALLPREPPALCLIHNLVTAQYVPFLSRLYPGARLALYFHGGETPGAGTITAEETRAAFARVHRVFTNTAFSRDQAVERGCDPAKVSICPVGFDVSEYVPPRREPRDELRLLSVGRASTEKGFDTAIEAVRLVVERGGERGRRLRYSIVGKGPALELLRARAADLPEHVRFAGELSNGALRARYAAADVLLLPSLRTPSWQEAQACVAQEAMLMELPVVATRTGGLQESTAPELHPYSFEPGDVPALAERIEALLTLPHEARIALGRAGRAFALARYEIGALTRRLVDEAVPSPSQRAA